MRQSNWVSDSEKDMRKLYSVVIVVAMISAGMVAVFAFAPANVAAAVELTVDGTDLAPPMGVFAGDNNITMLWLKLTPQDEAVGVTSLTFDLTATSTVVSADVTKIILWSDLDAGMDIDWGELNFQANMGVLATVNNPNFPQVVPIAGYSVPAFTLRGIFVYIDVAAGTEGKSVGIELVNVVCADPSPVINNGASSDTTMKHVIWSDEMEGGVGGWSVTGSSLDVLWHQTNYWYYNYLSPTTSWWYSNETTRMYDTPGQRNYGNLTSEVIDLSGYSSPGMSFWHDLKKENFPNVDEARFLIEDQSNPGVWNEEKLWSISMENWTKESFDLSAYAGRTIKLRFYFDTVDSWTNIYMGWFIDRLYIFGSLETNDVATQDFSAPNFALPTESVYVNATITNLASGIENNGTNGIDAWLRVDGAYIPPKINIPSLSPGGSQPVSFQWNPGSTGDYEVCIHAWPVSGETATANNLACKTVQVRDIPAKKVAVVRSYGTKVGLAISTWQNLNANWESYGPTPIEIDWNSLNKTGITYGDIVASGADVLVVSSSGGLIGPMQPWSQLSDTEITAIKQYTVEGHGLIATYSAFYYEIPNNNKLTDMFGIVDQAYNRTITDGATDLDKVNPTHVMFTNVPADPFTIGNPVTSWPDDDNTWDQDDLRPGSMGGEYLAMSSANETALVAFKKLVYFSWIPEFQSTSVDRQLLYNAMVWSQYETATHDVAMSNIEGPIRAKPSPLVDITATITNLGSTLEDNATAGIDVILTQDGSKVDQINIPSLNVAESQGVTLSWDPPDAPVPQTYTMCMEAIPVAMETDFTNNYVCMDIEVIGQEVVVVGVLDSWGTDNAGMAPWDELNSNWMSYGSFEVLIDYTTLDKESITLKDLQYSGADILLISSSNSTGLSTSEFTMTEIAAIETFVETIGMGIMATGTTLNTQNLPNNNFLGPLFGVDAGGSFTELSGVTTYQKVDPLHGIFYNVPDNIVTSSGITCTPGVVAPDPNGWTPGLLMPGAVYIGRSTPEPAQGAMIVNDTGTYRGVFLTNSMEISSNVDDRQILYNAMVWAAGKTQTPIRPPNPPQDLWISVQGDKLQLDWIDTNPGEIDVYYNIYRAGTVDGFNFAIPPYDRVQGDTYLDPQPNAGIDSTNFYYVVRAINLTSGLMENNTDKVGKYYSLLHKGYNDISLPFIQQFTDVSIIFGAISTDINEVAVYYSDMFMWDAWPAGGLTDVDHTMGLRVDSTRNNLGFVSVGQVPKSTDIDLTIIGDSWFFVGYPCHNNYPLPGILDDNGLLGSYALVLYYDPTDRRAPWKWFNPNDPAGSPLTELETGKGYWIYMISDGTWTVPGE